MKWLFWTQSNIYSIPKSNSFGPSRSTWMHYMAGKYSCAVDSFTSLLTLNSQHYTGSAGKLLACCFAGFRFCCGLCFVFVLLSFVFSKVMLWRIFPSFNLLRLGFMLALNLLCIWSWSWLLISCLYLLNAGITNIWHHAWHLNLLNAIHISHSHGYFWGGLCFFVQLLMLCAVLLWAQADGTCFYFHPGIFMEIKWVWYWHFFLYLAVSAASVTHVSQHWSSGS